jgi:hypothetical protein
MNMQEIRQISKRMNVSSKNLKKPDLIRSIQKAEGNFDCFGSNPHECGQINCLWRNDCLTTS